MSIFIKKSGEYFEKLLSFLKEIHLSDSNVSSKRFYGGITYLMASYTILCCQRGLTNELLYTSAALIGLDSVFKGVASIRNKSNEKDSSNS
jgi:hypothetical protein